MMIAIVIVIAVIVIGIIISYSVSLTKSVASRAWQSNYSELVQRSCISRNLLSACWIPLNISLLLPFYWLVRHLRNLQSSFYCMFEQVPCQNQHLWVVSRLCRAFPVIFECTRSHMIKSWQKCRVFLSRVEKRFPDIEALQPATEEYLPCTGLVAFGISELCVFYQPRAMDGPKIAGSFVHRINRNSPAWNSVAFQHWGKWWSIKLS